MSRGSLGAVFFRLIVVSSVVLGAGCTCGVLDVKTTRFACTTDTDCAADFSCVGGECVSACSDGAPCPSGLDCNTGRCVDRDECRSGTACGSNSECVNTPGSYQCRCVTGFSGTTTTGAPATCVDVDECAAAPDCGPLGVCANTPGSYECGCAPGTFGATVVGGPTSCSTVDRCTSIDQCGPNALCESTSTSFTCRCASGFMGQPTTGTSATCVDVDECSMGRACGDIATCANSAGSFKCTCPTGYTGEATVGMAATCLDVNECTTTNCGANATCTNTAGSFTCACQQGYSGQVVTGGPTTCSLTMGTCMGVNCGANATCMPTGSTYQCSCNAGFTGQTMNGPTTCVDVNECADPLACGSNAVCTNSSGSYGCSCATGFMGPSTTGMPTTCTAAGVVVLGTNEALTNPTIQLGQPVPAGEHLVLGFFGASTPNAVTDSRGNAWTRLVTNNACGSCGNASVWTTTVRDGGAFVSGDTISVPTSSSGSIWVANAGRYASPDVTGTMGNAQDTTTPSVSTSSAVTDPNELVIGVIGARNPTALTLDAGAYDVGLAVNGANSSGIIGSRITPVSGTWTYAATSSTPIRFSGVIATFYSAAQRDPSALALTHTANARGFTVSWAGGRSNGGNNGCAIQVQLVDGSWSSLGSGNCDADTSARAVNLPAGANWYGSSWSSLPVRLMRVSDQAVIGTFAARLSCSTRASSSTATPTIDEDCDSEWDDHVCLSYAWVSDMVYGTNFAACTNGSTTTTKTCAATNELENRYTVGMSASVSPAQGFSSDSVGTACQGSFVGAVQWTCTPSGCTYR